MGECVENPLTSESDQEVTEAHISFLARGQEKSLELLSKINHEFSEDDSSDASQWRERACSVKALVTRPYATIGVVGVTGVGKSKCINALLDQDLLPSSDSQACTAAPVEICYNDSEDDGDPFKAVVEFIQLDEWKKEIDLLLEDLSDGEPKTDWASIEDDQDEGPAKQAFEKIKAIYPSILETTPDQLGSDELLTDAVTKILGTKIEFASDDLEAFSQQLRPYIGCQFGDEEQESFEHWPLISRVQIFTKSKLLQVGVKLVDLPGIQDNNAARAAVADGYLEKCSSILVMTPIVRAKNDKWATDFLRGPTAKKLRIAGTLHHAAFICTKTDESLELIKIEKTPGLREKVKPLQEQLSQHKARKKTLDKQFKEMQATLKQVGGQAKTESEPVRKKLRLTKLDQIACPKGDGQEASHGSTQEHSDVDKRVTGSDNGTIRQNYSQSKLTDHDNAVANPKVEELVLQNNRHDIGRLIGETSNKIKQVQLKHRNDESQQTIQRFFSNNFRMAVTDASSEQGEILLKTPTVLCVCSQRYMQMQSDDSLEDAARAGFLSIDDTGIPALGRHCASFAFDMRMKAFNRFFNALYHLTNAIKLYAIDGVGGGRVKDDDFRRLELSLREYLDECDLVKSSSLLPCMCHLAYCEQNFPCEIEQTVSNMKTKLSKRDSRNSSNAKSKTMTQVNDMLNNWSRNIHGGTFKAIVRRQGCFTNRTHSYDFNLDLAQAVSEPSTSALSRLFNFALPRISQVAVSRCVGLIDKFDESASSIIRQMGAYNQGLTILMQQSSTTKKIVRSHIDDAAQAIITDGEARRVIRAAITEHMKPCYIAAGENKGRGAGVKMKAIVREHVFSGRDKMYGEATSSTRKKFSAQVDKSFRKLQSDLQSLFTNHTRDYRWFLSEESKELRDRRIKHGIVLFPIVSNFESTSLKNILDMLEMFGYGKYNLQLNWNSSEIDEIDENENVLDENEESDGERHLDGRERITNQTHNVKLEGDILE